MTDIDSVKYTAIKTALIFFLLFLAFSGGLAEVMAQDETPIPTPGGLENAPVELEEVVNTPVPVEGLPIIDIWYGPDQTFGEIGTPQGWVNILGNVSDIDGIGALAYALNDGPEQAASIGPDGRRLSFRGDFNIDIRREELLEGKNEVVITATDILGNQASETVRFTYEAGNIWPFPYEIVWSETTNIQDVAQVVDGKWVINPEGLRTAESGSERSVAIGDLVWTDYEVVVPITIHRVQKINDNGQPPALGMIMRWNGHSENKEFEGEQPKTGRNSDSAIAWWHWEKTTKLEFDKNKEAQELFEPRIGVSYMFKVRVALEPGLGTQYRVKVWPANQPEPDEWNLTHQGKPSSPQRGSLLLLASQVDATFGDITITGLAPLPTPTPLPTNTPTVTPTPTITNTPLPTDTPSITATPSGTESAFIASSGAVVKGTPDAMVDPEVTSTSSANSFQMYGLTFVAMAVLLVGLALARRRLIP